ncbi:hypothetical protein [Aureibacillus halotolerans]|uniref:Uncharacterized protein n=1 Tax=Aureibacillus halotolerans TaxID=1508390 RepID=A0A4R6U0E4_9BACI|nr:hypothetical protein [Aureibacillus halotolerans]TDQ37745.1 hypothetical protein EV213_112105 [Aureibacillus halotolerans]
MKGLLAKQLENAYRSEEKSLHELQLSELEGTESGLDALHVYERFVAEVTEDKKGEPYFFWG